MANPTEITLVCLGPLTNLALALALEPRLVDAVAGVVLMGGAATVGGNINPAAEANVHKDPHAADVVFTADWPLTMVGLDVTHKAIMHSDFLADLKNATATTQFLDSISHFYMDFYRRVQPALDGMPMHDPSTIAYVINPSLFITRPAPVRVITDGIAAGMTLPDFHQGWASPNGWTDIPLTNICVDVDVAGLLNLYQKTITRPD